MSKDGRKSSEGEVRAKLKSQLQIKDSEISCNDEGSEIKNEA